MRDLRDRQWADPLGRLSRGGGGGEDGGGGRGDISGGVARWWCDEVLGFEGCVSISLSLAASVYLWVFLPSLFLKCIQQQQVLSFLPLRRATTTTTTKPQPLRAAFPPKISQTPPKPNRQNGKPHRKTPLPLLLLRLVHLPPRRPPRLQAPRPRRRRRRPPRRHRPRPAHGHDGPRRLGQHARRLRPHQAARDAGRVRVRAAGAVAVRVQHAPDGVARRGERVCRAGRGGGAGGGEGEGCEFCVLLLAVRDVVADKLGHRSAPTRWCTRRRRWPRRWWG